MTTPEPQGFTAPFRICHPPNYDAPSGGDNADYFTHLDPASAQARYLKTTGAGYVDPPLDSTTSNKHFSARIQQTRFK